MALAYNVERLATTAVSYVRCFVDILVPKIHKYGDRMSKSNI